MSKIFRFIKILINSPLLLIIAISGGIYVGFYHKWMAHYLSPVAGLYTNLLQITVIPIIAITIFTSLTKLLVNGGSNKYISKIMSVFVTMIFLTGTFAVVAGYIMQPGKNMASDPSIVRIVEDAGGSRIREITVDDPIEHEQSVSIVEFLVNTVPKNIFNSLSEANMLQIIAFCVIFSIACGAATRRDRKDRIGKVEDYLVVLHKINEKVLIFLPLGSFCLLGTQLSNVSDSALDTIFKLAITMLIVIMLLSFICSIILWKCSKSTYLETLKALFSTLIMAFSTQTSIVCVPRAVTAMTERLKFDKQTVELTIPLGVPLCQFSTICFYAIGTIFVVNIFNEALSFSSYTFIILASVLTSFAASGVKGVIYYSLMAGILAPLGLPLGSTIALFIAVDPLIDPFGTVFHIYATCCASAVCCKINEKEIEARNRKIAKSEKLEETEIYL